MCPSESVCATSKIINGCTNDICVCFSYDELIEFMKKWQTKKLRDEDVDDDSDF